jgi:hypothetical protein
MIVAVIAGATAVQQLSAQLHLKQKQLARSFTFNAVHQIYRCDT